MTHVYCWNACTSKSMSNMILMGMYFEYEHDLSYHNILLEY